MSMYVYLRWKNIKFLISIRHYENSLYCYDNIVNYGNIIVIRYIVLFIHKSHTPFLCSPVIIRNTDLYTNSHVNYTEVKPIGNLSPEFKNY